MAVAVLKEKRQRRRAQFFDTARQDIPERPSQHKHKLDRGTDARTNMSSCLDL
jgi:hypothetical protein